MSPGSRLHAFGGVTRTLKGVDDIQALTDQMFRDMKDIDLDELWE